MYAVIETGGKQYRVNKGDTVQVERLDLAEGATIEFDKVLMLGGTEAQPVVGAPYIQGGKVTGTVKAQKRHEKISIFKLRRRKNYRKRQGHKQPYTEVEIVEISGA